MIYVAAIIAILIGGGLIHVALGEYRTLCSDINSLKQHSAKKNRMKITAEVISLGVNTDFPTQLLSWPRESDFEDKESFSKAVAEAKTEYYRSLNEIEVFGNTKLEYRYIAPDGESYISRTISRIPSEKNIDVVYGSTIGQKIAAYLNPDDYGDSILKATTKEQYEEYTKKVTKPQKAKMAIGAAVMVMGISAPWSFTALPI